MPLAETQPVIGNEAVAATCAELTGSRVVGVERLAGSVGNQDFMIFTDAGDFVLKAGPAPLLTAEAWATERVRQLGVSVPDIVVLETADDTLGLPFLLMRRMAGGAVTEASAALVEAGRQLRLTHSVQLPGYGALMITGTEAAGEHRTWAAFIDEVAGGLEDLVAGGVITGTFAARVSKTLTSCDELRFSQPGVLLHGDLKRQHVFVDRDRYVGIIDWGDACAGDPRFDLGRMSMAGPATLEAFLEGYGLQLSAELSRAFTAYRLVWNVDALLYEYRAGGDWFDTYRDGAAAAVTDLG